MNEQTGAGMSAGNAVGDAPAIDDDEVLVDFNGLSDDEGPLLNLHSKKSSVRHLLNRSELESHKKGFMKAAQVENKKLKLVYLLLSPVGSGVRVIDAMRKMHTHKKNHCNGNILVSHGVKDNIGRALVQLSKSLAADASSLRGNLKPFHIFL